VSKVNTAVLDIDMGNTRLKWRLSDIGEIVARGAHSWEGNKPLPSSLWDSLTLSPGRVRVASVAGAERIAQLSSLVLSLWSVSLELAESRLSHGDLRNAYEQPSVLGVDRWLAVLAAYQRDGGPCLIVDCGSAVTVDLLAERGRHIGGYILPGMSLMRRALFSDTDAVKVPVGDLPAGLAPGRCTEDAVFSGLALMVLGLVEQAGRKLNATGACRIYLTGGDAERLRSYFENLGELFYEPELVLDGLALALP